MMLTTFFNRIHISETAFSILQLLPSNRCLPGEMFSVKQLCLLNCKSDTWAIERYMKALAPDPLLGRGLFVSLSILVPFLDDVEIHDIFTRDCFMLRACAGITPMVKLLLKGVQASAWALKKTLPKPARQCFDGLEQDEDDRDLPISFSLPHRDEIRELLSGEGDHDLPQLGVQLSTLVSRWSALSVDQTYDRLH